MPLNNPSAYDQLQPQIQPEVQPPQVPDPTNPLVALRGQVIKPQDSTRLAGAASATDQLAGRVAAGSGVPSQNTMQLTQMMMDRASGLNNLPNRSELAGREFDLLAQRSEPAFNRSLDRAMSLNAAGGRMGSGLVTRDLADITSARSEDLSQARESLALRAGGQELSDRLGVLSSLSGIQGQLTGQDLAQAGQRLGDLGALSGVEQLIRGSERGERDELRGERGRADNMAEIANQRRIQQMEMEAAIQSQLFNQLIGRGGMAAELGFNGITPLNAIPHLTGEAGRQGSEAIDTGREALSNYFLQQALQGQKNMPGARLPGSMPTGTDLGIPEFQPDIPELGMNDLNRVNF